MEISVSFQLLGDVNAAHLNQLSWKYTLQKLAGTATQDFTFWELLFKALTGTALAI